MRLLPEIEQAPIIDHVWKIQKWYHQRPRTLLLKNKFIFVLEDYQKSQEQTNLFLNIPEC